MKVDRIEVRSNQEEQVEGLSIEYPYAFHQADLSSLVVPWHWHEAVEFDYVVSGTVEVTTTAGKYCFKEKEGFFINSNVLCCMRKAQQADTAVMHSHLFHPVFLSGHYKSIFETKYVNPVLQNRKLEIFEIRGKNDRQRAMQKKLAQAWYLQREPDTELLVRNLFSEIWMLLLEEVRNYTEDLPAVKLRDQERILTMLSYIHQSYMEKLTLEEIASAAFISSRECIRCFRSMIGQSPIEYLMSYRLEVAERLLRDTDASVTDIGLQTGFSSNAYFGKVFREKYGISPARYREQARKDARGRERG